MKPMRPLKSVRLMAHRMLGFSMVELMVAMTIGLILIVSVGYVYLGSRQTFRTLDNFSRIQENYRYVLDQIGVDVRMAGYSGCVNVSAIDPASPANIPVQPPAIVANPLPLALAQAVQGYAGADAWPGPAPAPANYVAGTDVFRVSGAQGQGTPVTAVMPAAGGLISIGGNPAGIGANPNPLLISDCTTADVFTAGAVNGAVSVTPAVALSKIYSVGAEVYPFMDTVYYIGTNPGGNPALYRIQNGAGEELVENVEDIELRFGVDADNNFAIDNYVAAAAVANWRQVLSVRVNLVFVSNNNVATAAQPYVVEGVNTIPGDTRLRQVATATFGLRNRLP